MRVRLARYQPRTLRNERVCDHHYGLALESAEKAGRPAPSQSDVPPCERGTIRAIVLDFLPSDGLLACDLAIADLRSE